MSWVPQTTYGPLAQQTSGRRLFAPSNLLRVAIWPGLPVSRDHRSRLGSFAVHAPRPRIWVHVISVGPRRCLRGVGSHYNACHHSSVPRLYQSHGAQQLQCLSWSCSQPYESWLRRPGMTLVVVTQAVSDHASRREEPVWCGLSPLCTMFSVDPRRTDPATAALAAIGSLIARLSAPHTTPSPRTDSGLARHAGLTQYDYRTSFFGGHPVLGQVTNSPVSAAFR